MDEKRTGKTGAERVKDWRRKHLRDYHRTEVLLLTGDVARLDALCVHMGLDRSSMIREMIRKARFVSG